MRKSTFLVVAAGLAAALVVGGLFASNMGFKLNRTLQDSVAAGGGTGNNSLALPYNQQTNLGDAFDLISDIDQAAGVPGTVLQVARFDAGSNNLVGYNGVSGTAFALVPGRGYTVQVGSSVNYIVVGSHDPGLVVNLDAAGTNGSATGNNFISYPYHSTSAGAINLINEINAASAPGTVLQVAFFDASSNNLVGYNGVSGTSFALNAGEAYLVQVGSDVNWVPSHY